MSLLHDDNEPRRGPGRQLADLAVHIGDWKLLGEAARAVRLAVFVEEQGIAPELEMDDRDATAVHAVAFDAQGVAVATGRLLPDAHIGRMAVLEELRGQGVGATILRALMTIAASRGDRELQLHAQRSAVGFYERAGFVAQGEEYIEAGIAHRRMARRLASAEPA
jgi:predicted GNAT family N-acyltransferase